MKRQERVAGRRRQPHRARLCDAGGPARAVFVTVVMPRVRNACRWDSGSEMAGNRTENVVVLLSGTAAMTTLTSVPMFTAEDEIWLPTENSSYRTPAFSTIPSYSQRSWTKKEPSGLKARNSSRSAP